MRHPLTLLLLAMIVTLVVVGRGDCGSAGPQPVRRRAHADGRRRSSTPVDRTP